MKSKILNEEGKVSLLIVVFIIVVLTFTLYNVNTAKTTYLNRDTKNKLDEIIRAEIIKVIDHDMLKDYTFGNGTIYYKYDSDTKKITKNFNESSSDFTEFKNELITDIKTRFNNSINDELVQNVHFQKINVEFDKIDLIGDKDVNGVYKAIFIPYIKVNYILEFTTSVSPITPIETKTYILDSSDTSSGKITITRNPEDRGTSRIIISGEVDVRYTIEANMY